MPDSTGLEFKEGNAFSVGVELELQLINLNSYNLILEAQDFLRRFAGDMNEACIKPEITQSMIEINSSPHTHYENLWGELHSIQSSLLGTAQKMHIGICGGGTHPFQKWKEQKVFQAERFLNLSAQYGYLAKQFTVFGQHIHIGCPNGEDALFLCHALAYYIPHFIALSASSPFNQGVDTSFDCSRLAVISAFPLSGTPPWLFKWDDFIAYFQKLRNMHVISSMKDFYWDIRPRPEFGTVEIRICDTPLTLQKACDIAFYAKNLAECLLQERKPIARDVYLVYLMNRFRASRFGFEARIINVEEQDQKILKDDILQTCQMIEKKYLDSHSLASLERIRQTALQGKNDAYLLRQGFKELQTLEDLVREQVNIWAL